jgi:deferrochelatase/peroxidase EfeB
MLYLDPSTLQPADVQGNILRGYAYSRVRHLILSIGDAAAARRWLGVAASGGGDNVPVITSEASWRVKPVSCFNIGLTYAGLTALGTPAASLATFPDEFVAGMNARAVKIGDVGSSAPETWDAPFADPRAVHLIATINADDVAVFDHVQHQVLAAGEGYAFTLMATRDGWNFDADFVHFGYRDNFSQPRFAGIHDPTRYPDAQPLAPLGAMLLGYRTETTGLLWSIPQPDVLGRNGAFNAFRILAQDVAGFEAYLDTAADELLHHKLGETLLPAGGEAAIGAGMTRRAALRELVAAKMCGRWRNGTPLVLSPTTPDPQPPVSMTDFDYQGGTDCPFGAHMRRTNPRGGTIVQRASRHTRRLVRRSLPYGPQYDPARPDTIERGLLGNFIGANLGNQFEAIMCDWLNVGLEDPRITGSCDPLLGNNYPETSWFEIPLPTGDAIRLRGLPRFVRTRGGAYTFLPGLPAIRYLAGL